MPTHKKKVSNVNSVKRINRCLTDNCEAIFHCYRDSYPVPDTLKDSFYHCMLQAMQTRFPFEFWREEHPTLAGILDTETMGAKTGLYLSDIDAGLFKLYFPVFWSIPKGIIHLEDKIHLNLNGYTCANLAKVLNRYFPDTDAVVISHPMSVDSLINYSVFDFRDDNSATLDSRHKSGNWDFITKLESRLPDMYLESPTDMLIAVVYEAMLYTDGAVLRSLLESFDPNNPHLKKDTDAIIQHSFPQLDPRISAYPQRWVTPNMLPWLTYIQGSAIKAAITLTQLFGTADYNTDATESDMRISTKSETADNVLAVPYYSGIDFTTQAESFFTAFNEYCVALSERSNG